MGLLQGEGEKLARKNGELEAALRRVRAANRDSDAERDRLAARITSLESQARRPSQTRSLLMLLLLLLQLLLKGRH